MITLTINGETETKGEMADALIHIAGLIREGYTSGINPNWEMDGEEKIYCDHINDGKNDCNCHLLHYFGDSSEETQQDA